MLVSFVLENFLSVDKIKCKYLVNIAKWIIFAKSEISLYKNVRFLSGFRPIGRACNPKVE